jgi:transglutaminase-like putative cysteine protease
LLVEPLEQRQLLDSGLGSDITVGRTLSAYTTSGIQDHEITITYTVYNEQATEVSGVLLATTLEPGVTYKNASTLPDRNGQELAWSLGTLSAYGRTSVALTVSLADPAPLQLDGGARAFAMLDARAVSDDTAPAVLRTDAIPADLLASTPDANTTDPFVQEKAAELDYDPQKIFDFLHTQIGYNSYVGSLRGARGTLWSHAGNSLDEASLGVALLRASGIPARYAQGTLSDDLAQQLILSMFPNSLEKVGYVPADAQISDPAHDSTLLAETRDHYWIEFDTGHGFLDADPEFAGAQVGQTFTTVHRRSPRCRMRCAIRWLCGSTPS